MSMELTLHGMIRAIRLLRVEEREGGPHRHARMLARLRARREAEAARRRDGWARAEAEGEGGRDGRHRP